MQTSHRLKLQNDLVVYPKLLWGGKKKHLFGVGASAIFVICGLFIILSTKGENVLKGWGVLLFFGAALFLYIIQLSWGPFLVMNEQEIRIRPNPFFALMLLYWNEIASITPSVWRGDIYLDIALAPAQLEAFLQRQSPLIKKFLAKRLRRTHLIAHFPFLLLPSAISTLLEAIQKRYSTQIRQYHIIIETQLTFKKNSSREKREVFHS